MWFTITFFTGYCDRLVVGQSPLDPIVGTLIPLDVKVQIRPRFILSGLVHITYVFGELPKITLVVFAVSRGSNQPQPG